MDQFWYVGTSGEVGDAEEAGGAGSTLNVFF